MLSTATAPKRSATAPATGWAAPHSSIWIASASANRSRPQPCALDIGVRKKPSPERVPKPRAAIRQPQTRMTAGVRQDIGRPATDPELSASLLLASCTAPSSSSRGSRGETRHRLLHDRQVDHGREHAEQHGEPPDQIIGAGLDEGEAAEPHAEEAAHLMAEEGEAG